MAIFEMYVSDGDIKSIIDKVKTIAANLPHDVFFLNFNEITIRIDSNKSTSDFIKEYQSKIETACVESTI